MKYQNYAKYLSKIQTGKQLPDAVYLHISAIEAIPPELLAYLHRTINELDLQNKKWNILKLFKKNFKVSLLQYPCFFDDPYPALEHSIAVDLEKGSYKESSYKKSSNPPILHRKETFLLEDHPALPEFKNITKDGEEAGLYKNPLKIGFKQAWEELIASKGLCLKKGRLVDIKQETSHTISADNVKVERHLTAIDRNSLSAPMQTLFRHGYLEGQHDVFDFGCGKGDDVRILDEHGVNVVGWDPIYYPNEEKTSADIVNLGFVINVIEDIKERNKALEEAYSKTRKVLVVSAMLGGETVLKRHQEYGDGVITKRKTFQKYYSQRELGSYIEDVLDESAIAVSPGIFYVFKDKLEEQNFLVERQRVKRTWQKLIYTKDPDKLKIKQRALFERHKDLFTVFWGKCLDLGRIPANDEFDQSEQLRAICGSQLKAVQVLFQVFGQEQLELATQARRDDLLVYFALGMFSRRRPYKHMPKTIQRDIKEFFGLYSQALEHAKELLFSVGNPENLNEACQKVYESLGVGWLKKSHSYTIHKSFINNLPPILRVYIGCATQLYGDTDDVDLLKIHIRSGKVSLMRYDDFDGKPLPLLTERIKIKLRQLDVDFFDYGDEFPPQPLYFKSNYINDSYPNYKKQAAFDKKLVSFDWLDLSGYGPHKEELHEKLGKNRLKIQGFRFCRTK